jgi:bisphosphoglycerate-independent phosphoglycerate mutase (AlkP superfamily)
MAEWWDNNDLFCDQAMWNISSNDVEHAKETIKVRRAEIETRYTKEKEALDAEFAAIETLERAASEFALNHGREQVQAAPEDTAPVEMGMSDGTEEKTHSRWRLHLGNRPSESDGAIGNVTSAPR